MSPSEGWPRSNCLILPKNSLQLDIGAKKVMRGNKNTLILKQEGAFFF